MLAQDGGVKEFASIKTGGLGFENDEACIITSDFTRVQASNVQMLTKIWSTLQHRIPQEHAQVRARSADAALDPRQP